MRSSGFKLRLLTPLCLQALIFHDDLKARKRVLGRLGYLDDEGVVTLKASSVLFEVHCAFCDDTRCWGGWATWTTKVL